MFRNGLSGHWGNFKSRQFVLMGATGERVFGRSVIFWEDYWPDQLITNNAQSVDIHGLAKILSSWLKIADICRWGD